MPITGIRQPVKGMRKKRNPAPRKKSVRQKNTKKQDYGTSKLEKYFAHEFLDRSGIKYIYQFKAESIGRFFDFAVVVPYTGQTLVTEEKDGLVSVVQNTSLLDVRLIIEVDGGYFHGDPRVVGDKGLNRMQMRNMAVDELKNRWCALQCIPIVRFWEKDIRENPESVKKILKKYLGIIKKNKEKEENFRKPHGSVVRKNKNTILTEKKGKKF